MSSHKKSSDSFNAYAYEPDHSLQEMIGLSVSISDIFSQERIDRCQRIVDDAKVSFFHLADADMDKIRDIVSSGVDAIPTKTLCAQLFVPVSNIKSQAEAFGFPLITSVCKYLMKYCEDGANDLKPTGKKEAFIITKLIEVLQHALSHQIMDSGGEIEEELISIIELARS